MGPSYMSPCFAEKVCLSIKNSQNCYLYHYLRGFRSKIAHSLMELNSFSARSLLVLSKQVGNQLGTLKEQVSDNFERGYKNDLLQKASLIVIVRLPDCSRLPLGVSRQSNIASAISLGRHIIVLTHHPLSLHHQQVCRADLSPSPALISSPDI